MSSGNAKDMRKQLRSVVGEQLGPLLASEIFQGLAERVQQNVQTVLLARLDEINQEIRVSLQRMDSRSQDVQTFLINQVQAAAYQAQNITTPTAPTESNVLEPQVGTNE